jgi:hypothetical protein
MYNNNNTEKLRPDRLGPERLEIKKILCFGVVPLLVRHLEDTIYSYNNVLLKYYTWSVALKKITAFNINRSCSFSFSRVLRSI